MTVPTETGRKLPAPYAIRNEPLLVLRVAETIARERQIFERGPETIASLAGRLTLAQRSDAAQGTTVHATPAPERKQASEREQEREKADALTGALTSTLRAELNEVRSSAETARVKQPPAPAQERGRADALARELATLRAELDTARMVGKEAIQAIEVGIRQTQALEHERDKSNNLAHELALVRAELDVARISVSKAVQASEEEIKQARAIEQERGRAENLARELAALRAELDTARATASEAVHPPSAEVEQRQEIERERAKAATLARDLTSLRAELDTARNAASEAAKTFAADVEQKQALEQELKQQRDGAEALARQLASLRTELDTSRAALSEATEIAEAAKIEQALVVTKERDSTETRVRELASAQHQTEECSTRLAAAYAEILQVTETSRVIAAEQKHALVKEVDGRPAALTYELASVRTQLEARDRQLATLNASRALSLPGPPVINAHACVATSGTQMAERMNRLPEWTSVQAAALYSARSSASEFPFPDAPSSSREPARGPDPSVALQSETSTPGSGAPSSPVDEQRLLARANALLRQADISGARQLLEHVLERGSARAALMLAETYDTRVLQSWHARGIPGDVTRARELYERAQAGGIEDAKERIKMLK